MVRIEYTRSVRDSLAALMIKSAIKEYKLMNIKTQFFMQHIYSLEIDKILRYISKYLYSHSGKGYCSDDDALACDFRCLKMSTRHFSELT